MLKAIVLAALMLGAASLCAPEARAAEMTMRFTVYIDHGVTDSGHWTAWGTAACSWNVPLYTVLELPDGYQVTCLDRGLLGNGTPYGWLDMWTPDWATGAAFQRYYGEYVRVRIVRWGGG
jgi:hypothetical protein